MIKVNNVYYMLAYTYKELNIKDKKHYDEEEFESIYDLFADMMANIINRQIKRGLNRDYISYSEPLLNIKGKINITESIKKNTSIKHELVCEYDEYSINSYFNRIIKTALLYLKKSKKIKNDKYMSRIRKILYYFESVNEIVDIHTIKWNTFRYDKNTSSYKFIMEVCKLILTNLYIGNDNGKLLFNEFLEDKKMADLYEKFIKAFYEKKFSNLITSSPKFIWNYDEGDYYGDPKNLPNMRTDIVLHDNKINNTLIIDAKFYSSIFNMYYDSITFNSNNLYQIYAYVNRENKIGNNVTGLLLYAKTENNSIGWNRFKIDGNNYVITDLDLSGNFSKIERKLENIVSWLRNELTDKDLDGE